MKPFIGFCRAVVAVALMAFVWQITVWLLIVQSKVNVLGLEIRVTKPKLKAAYILLGVVGVVLVAVQVVAFSSGWVLVTQEAVTIHLLFAALFGFAIAVYFIATFAGTTEAAPG